MDFQNPPADGCSVDIVSDEIAINYGFDGMVISLETAIKLVSDLQDVIKILKSQKLT